MKYILMCGGKYNTFEKPKHLLEVNGEVIVERTIRLLRENGIKDIAISTDNPAFEYLKVPLLKHENTYIYDKGETKGWWLDAFYPTDEPTCYIFGDVYFSENAIKTIVNTDTEDIEMFGSTPPFSKDYPKQWIEPFALKVKNTEHLKKAVEKTKELAIQGKTWRKNPIIWELWTVIKDVPLQTEWGKYEYNYVSINDYTSDIDDINDVKILEKHINIAKGVIKMIKVEVIEQFRLGKFHELRNIVRKRRDIPGELFKEDTFECDENMYKYLTTGNSQHRAFVKLIEVIPPKEEIKEEPKAKPEKSIKVEPLKVEKKTSTKTNLKNKVKKSKKSLAK